MVGSPFDIEGMGLGAAAVAVDEGGRTLAPIGGKYPPHLSV